MANERNIGRVIAVDSLSVYVRLDEDLKSLYKSGFEEIYPVARINSYIIIPIGADKIVAMVNRVMTREETDFTKSSGAIFFTESNRYLYATMVGTIECGNYIQGVYNYPILDNPVWYVTREDLDIIFDQKVKDGAINYKEDFYLPVGTSPTFPDYQIKINPDKMFAKHIAILGNTGSGKSCTLTAILQSLFQYKYNDKVLKSGHIVIFDTNGEYKDAFNIDQESRINPFWINDEGLKIPYWFMNYDDMDYLFEPTTGTQGPILKRALALAKSQVVAEKRKLIPKLYINNLKALIDSLSAGAYKAKSAIVEDIEPICNAFNKLRDDQLTDFDVNEICNALDSIKTQKAANKVHLANDYIKGSYDVIVINHAVETILQELVKYQESIIEQTSSENRNIDVPFYYKFQSLISTYFDYAIKESAVSEDKMNEYISTLKLRMQSFVDDIRLASPLLLNNQSNINDVLVQLLAYILGDYCNIYRVIDNEDSSIYQKYYKDSKCEQGHNQITIIDMSLLPFQVLETITGLVGRLILEFLSRFDKDERGKMPVVIALEEAQNYIPENNRKDRESISRKIFERIAREGRKYGLSLLVSSQRPSELSKTVLSQCNSFIVHRIQNPDDQSYIRKLVSAANSEILSQMPTLPQQHVIIMGDCVRTPVVARMNTAKPRPNSNNPEFIYNWIQDGYIDYKRIINRWLENDADENEVVE